MRKKDREITDRSEIEKILNEAKDLRLAMCDENEPYIVAMNYAYENGWLYMHSAIEGRKIDMLKKDNRVAFQTDIGAEIVIFKETFRCTTNYMSVFGAGRATLVSDKAEKIDAMEKIMGRYTGKTGNKYPDNVLEMTVVIKVEIEEMTGKKHGY
jgi:nitroimidazol reductase NimA-like FMN-containing flavoprotein (pyridoxamine 5'-phosphate oxidase superfamily)